MTQPHSDLLVGNTQFCLVMNTLSRQARTSQDEDGLAHAFEVIRWDEGTQRGRQHRRIQFVWKGVTKSHISGVFCLSEGPLQQLKSWRAPRGTDIWHILEHCCECVKQTQSLPVYRIFLCHIHDETAFFTHDWGRGVLAGPSGHPSHQFKASVLMPFRLCSTSACLAPVLLCLI